MIDDKQVWTALDAYEDEIREWRIFGRMGGDHYVVVMDAAVPDYTVDDISGVCDTTISYQVVRDRETAEKYVRWQAMKIALEHKTDRSDK